MNTAKQIAFYKQMLEQATNTRLVAEQQVLTATRLETQAKSALEELGDSSGRAAKAKKFELSAEKKMQLMANITRGKRAVN